MAELEVVEKRVREAQARIDAAQEKPEVAENDAEAPTVVAFGDLQADVRAELTDPTFSASDTPVHGTGQESFFYDPPSFLVLGVVFFVLWLLKRV